jgi:hypothetical protein
LTVFVVFVAAFPVGEACVAGLSDFSARPLVLSSFGAAPDCRDVELWFSDPVFSDPVFSDPVFSDPVARAFASADLPRDSDAFCFGVLPRSPGGV